MDILFSIDIYLICMDALMILKPLEYNMILKNMGIMPGS